MAKRHNKQNSWLNIGIVAGVSAILLSYLFVLDNFFVPVGATSTNAVVANVVVPATCFTVLSNINLNFGSVSPGQSTTVSNAVMDNDLVGNNQANAFIDGTNWVVITTSAVNYLPSNTAWNGVSGGTVTSSNALQLSFANTNFVVGTTATTNALFYFGTAVPSGQQADAYSQTINIENSC
ncbi:MAG: hypothetical protein KGH98_01320 [Candidatus Micrarchaeota archaeon]|nr:hypothetical protein [Candidatus Micrarchaeota archaeon]